MRPALGVAATGLALTLAAFAFDTSPLFVPGVAFTLVGVLTPAWVWLAARTARLHRRLPVDRAVEGEPLEAMIEVSRGWLGLPGGEVLDPLAGQPVSLRVPLSLISGARRAEIRVVARFPRRGRRRLDPPSLLVRDLLGLTGVLRRGEGTVQEVLVLPRTEPVRWMTRDRSARAEGSDARLAEEPLAAVDVDGLRPYRPGTPASRIHWPALARGAGLIERRLRADGDSRPLVVLDARCGPAGGEVDAGEVLDAAVRAAASLTLELARRGGCRLLLPGERRAVPVESDLAGWPGVHARLALVEGGVAERPPVLGPGAKAGPVLYVAAQALERLPAAISGAGARSCLLVLPAGVPAPAGATLSFEVCGCRGYALRTAVAPARERAA